MKVYIQSNKCQSLAAKVASYSFERFKIPTEIIDVDKHSIIKNLFNKNYIRNGKKQIFKEDLQSFTLLRFLIPSLAKEDSILIVDPDVFAVRPPTEILNYFNSQNNNYIFCTFYKNRPRSEVMLLKPSYVNWNFTLIADELSNLSTDYSDLMNLQNPGFELFEIDKKFNHHDNINNDTILLHTTNRFTQPWKLGLDLEFKKNYDTPIIIKTYFRKLFKLNYNQEILSKKYYKHNNLKVFEFVTKLFSEALKSKFISDEEIKDNIKSKFISELFYNEVKKFNE
jgi:hypothetical protein